MRQQETYISNYNNINNINLFAILEYLRYSVPFFNLFVWIVTCSGSGCGLVGSRDVSIFIVRCLTLEEQQCVSSTGLVAL